MSKSLKKFGPSRCAIVTAPCWGDVDFLKKWTGQAMTATLCLTKIRGDGKTKEFVDQLEVIEPLNFHVDAIAVASATLREPAILRLRTDLGRAFARLCALNLFVHNGHCYEMALARRVDEGKVRGAIIVCALSKGADNLLDPTVFLDWMPEWDAALYQAWMRKLDARPPEKSALLMPNCRLSALTSANSLDLS